MPAKVYKATLLGGPCDGLEVELVGIGYSESVARKVGKGLAIEARYHWSQEGEKLFGIFDGYFEPWTDKRVNRLGARLPKKGKKNAG